MKKNTPCQYQEACFSWRELVRKVNYACRLFATVLAFFLFGFGSVIFYLILLPLSYLNSKDYNRRVNRVRALIRYAFRFFLNITELLGILGIKTVGLEKLQTLKGCLIICNHPTLLDVLIITSRLKNIQCIVKKELWANPFVCGIVQAAGYIRNDLNPEELLISCKTQLAQGENIIIFPEGTRSRAGEPIKLLRGLGNLSLAANADIQTLILKCNPTILPKGRRWYNIPSKRAEFQLQVGRFFLNRDYQGSEPRSIRVRKLMRNLEHYYNDQIYEPVRG